MLMSGLKTLLRDSLHGGVLKSLALIARLSFFVLVVPGLLSGELATYVFANSMALLLATLLLFGLNEELARLIKGSREVAHGYLGWFYGLSALVTVGFGAAAIYPGPISACFLFAAAVTSGRYTGGIVRSIDPAVFERQQNLPWCLFIVLELFLQHTTAIELIVVMAFCMVLVQWLSIWQIFRRLPGRPADSRFHSLRHLWAIGVQGGFDRLLSNLFLLGFNRGLMLWPVWLAVSASLDEVALAVSVGGIISQYGLIPANRAYARWCKYAPVSRADWSRALLNSGVLAAALMLLSGVALAVAMVFDLMPPQFASPAILLQAIVFYSLLPGFRMLRYLVWSRNLLARMTTVLTAGMFVLSGLIVLLAPQPAWFAVIALVAFAGTLCLAITSRRYFS